MTFKHKKKEFNVNKFDENMYQKLHNLIISYLQRAALKYIYTLKVIHHYYSTILQCKLHSLDMSIFLFILF